MPGLISSIMERGSSVRGLSDVMIVKSASLGCDPAHHGSFRPVSVAAASEYQNQSARTDPVERLHRLLKRVGRVGVVDENVKRPVRRDPLQPSRHPFER